MDENEWLAERFEEHRARHVRREQSPFSAMGFTVAGGRIAEIDVIGDPSRVGEIAAAVLGSG